MRMLLGINKEDHQVMLRRKPVSALSNSQASTTENEAPDVCINKRSAKYPNVWLISISSLHYLLGQFIILSAGTRFTTVLILLKLVDLTLSTFLSLGSAINISATGVYTVRRLHTNDVSDNIGNGYLL